MNIGIFLGFGPQVKLKREGLGRYLGDLIQGFLDQDYEVTVAYPHWLRGSFDDLLNDYGIDNRHISVLMTQDDPVLWKIYNVIHGKKDQRMLTKIVRRLSGWMMKLSNRQWKHLAEIHDRALFIVWLFINLPLAMFLTVAYALSVPRRWFIKIKNFVLLIKRKAKRYVSDGKCDRFQVERLLKEYDRYQETLSEHKTKEALFLSLFQQMNEYERGRLVDLVNRKSDCDIWFVPGLFWPEAADIAHATVVYNAPDLTTSILAESFAGVPNTAYATGMCRKTLENGTYFITYCNYVKKTLMEREYMKEPWQTKAIPHSNHDLLPYIHIDEALAKQNHTTKDYTDFFSWNLLQTGRVRYLFYASQPRHNKNIITMLRAYEYLIRKRFVRVRLFLTANVYNNAEVSKFIEDHALSHHVMTFPNVSNQKLAALYHCATLVVNPTLYEGGFPFTFGEGMSVGTPSVMSDIPQVREVLEPAGLEDIMFDPYDWRAMADKIEYALQHVDELYERELPLYQKLAERTPDVMAQDYVKAFEEFMEIDRQRKAAQTAEGACASS